MRSRGCDALLVSQHGAQRVARACVRTVVRIERRRVRLRALPGILTAITTVKEFSVTIDIDAPADRVWTVMSDVAKWAEWTPSVKRIDLLTNGPLAVGSRVKIYQPKLPPALWEVSEVRPGESFTWVSRAPGVRVTGRHAIERRGAGSRVTLSISYEGALGGLLAWLMRDANVRYPQMEANGLKARSEGATHTVPNG